jgi:hypothetical protein
MLPNISGMFVIVSLRFGFSSIIYLSDVLVKGDTASFLKERSKELLCAAGFARRGYILAYGFFLRS